MSDKIINNVVQQLEKDAIFPYKSLGPTLAVIHKPEDDQSAVSYLKSLQKTGAYYGAIVDDYPAANVNEAANLINTLSKSLNVHGIIIVSDYGSVMNRVLYDLIPSRLDIDGLSYASIGRLIDNNSAIAYRNAPCTAAACFKIMEEFRKTIDPAANDFSGNTCLIIGRSIRIGRPLAEILTQQNMTVTLAHTKTPYHIISDEYNYIVSAIGKPNYWNGDNELYFSTYDDRCYIDVGMNVDNEGKLCGDIDREWFTPWQRTAIGKAYITPVTTGVGKVTTTILFAKLFSNAAEFFKDSRGAIQFVGSDKTVINL